MAPERGRWQFTLRGALLLLVLATLPLAYIGRTLVEVRRTESAASAILKKQGTVAPGAISPGVDSFVRRTTGAAEAAPQTITGGADVTDADLQAIGDLPTVEVLSLIGASITDDGLKPLAKLHRLKALYLGNTSIGDAGLAHLRGLPAVGELHLQDTNLTDAGLAHLATMPTLQTVYLARTAVTDAGLEAFHRLRPDVVTFR